ncbi:MAG: hypothetical protein MI867_26805 [Pseudomonadales bacterium]|nr:hypothetical protein [Pseudomonadales bacterium]
MKAAKSTKKGFAKTSSRALWVLPFVIGGSLWAAIETQRYFAEQSANESQATPFAATEAQPIVLAEETASELSIEEVSDADLVSDDTDLSADLDPSLEADLEPIGEEEAVIELDLDDGEPSDFLSVEEILNEDVDAIDTEEEQQTTPPEEEEFVNLNEILYGTTDEEKIQEIKAQEEGIEQPSRQSLELEMQALKEKVLEINRDLFVLEEDLLFPSSTQINVFVSFDAKEYFALDGVTLKVDDRPISNHLYTKREVKALERGAVQRLFTGNLTTGDHELVAVVTGVGPEGRDYRRAISLDFEKSSGTKYIELKIIGDDLRKQPIFQLKEWD